MATRIQLCGTVVAEVAGRRIERELPGRQGRLLFVYLCLNRERDVPRAELIDALWRGETPAAADTSLSALLSKVRRALGGDTIEGRTALRLRLPEGAWIDVEAAADGLHRAESAAARGEWADAWGPGRVAQHIAARPFLAGEDAPWVDETRRRLEDLHVRALEVVGTACLRIGGAELATAERTARTLIEHAPYRESGYRLLMETLATRGNAAEALLVYEQLRTLLRIELGAAPSVPTQELHRTLLG